MGYVGAAFCLLLAWMAIDYGSPVGFCFSIASAALIFPPIWKRLGGIGRSPHWSVRWFFAVIGLFAAIGFNGSTPKAEAAKAERVAKNTAKVETERNAVLAQAEKENAKEADRKKSGEHCLSGWDGSFPDLKDSVKASLRNPRSFEHVNTAYSPVDDNGTFGLIMSYRAENGFGGLNLEAIGVEVDAQTCAFKRATEHSLAARLKPS